MKVPMPHRGLLPTLAAVALLAACGGDDGPSKDEFIEEADAICAEGETKAEELGRDAFADPQNPTREEVLTLLQEAVPIQRDIIDQVRALEQPADDEDEIDAFLTEAEQATNEVAEIRDPQAAIAFFESTETPNDPFYEADQAAQDYGLKVCGD
jgi:hypothetical protein